MARNQLDSSIKRSIGQHFVFGFHGFEASDDIKRLIMNYFVGNIILMKRNVKNPEQVRRLTAELQSLAKAAGHQQPLMIGIDQENGLVSAFSSPSAGTQFPGAMASGAIHSKSLIESANEASAKELKAVGVNWVYSPVVDINSDPRNPVIGVRSFGDDPSKVGQLASIVSRRMMNARVAPSPKHFPGHGDTHVDSHLALPVIEKSLDELIKTELVPFTRLFQEGVPTIMSGHMALPKITGDERPASLSRIISTDILRKQLEFKGVLVTDCLEMEAVVAAFGSEGGAVEALGAGADVAMICHTMTRQKGAVEAVYDAVQSGKLSHEDLRASETRISGLKEAYAGSWDDALNPKIDSRFASMQSKHRELSKEAYKSCITQLNAAEDPDSFPLSPSERGRIVLFTPKTESINLAVDDADGILRTAEGKLRNTAGPSYLAFAQSISKRLSNPSDLEHIVYDEDTKGCAALDANTRAVVFVSRNANQSEWQTKSLVKLLDQLPARSKLILVASCGPYDFSSSNKALWAKHAVLASFEFTPSALDAVAGVILGEFPATGKLPVELL